MIYDCVIVGGGPAGLTAGIYLARANKKIIIAEKMAIGGQVSEIGLIENYPGFASISGGELSNNMFMQAKKLGVEFAFGDAQIEGLNGQIKRVKVGTKAFETKTIIIAIGSIARTLDVENEKKFIGRGVSYCATCDGNFFKGKVVAVVGAGDSAVSNAQYLSPIAQKVYILSKYEHLRLVNSTYDSLSDLKNVEVIPSARVVAIEGQDKVKAIKIEREDGTKSLEIDGIFVSIGRNPDTEQFKGKISLDDKGYIIADSEMRTNIDGIFVAGDIIAGSLKQIVSAASSGAVASTSVLKYLNQRR